MEGQNCSNESKVPKEVLSKGNRQSNEVKRSNFLRKPDEGEGQVQLEGGKFSFEGLTPAP